MKRSDSFELNSNLNEGKSERSCSLRVSVNGGGRRFKRGLAAKIAAALVSACVLGEGAAVQAGERVGENFGEKAKEEGGEKKDFLVQGWGEISNVGGLMEAGFDGEGAALVKFPGFLSVSRLEGDGAWKLPAVPRGQKGSDEVEGRSVGEKEGTMEVGNGVVARCEEVGGVLRFFGYELVVEDPRELAELRALVAECRLKREARERGDGNGLREAIVSEEKKDLETFTVANVGAVKGLDLKEGESADYGEGVARGVGFDVAGVERGGGFEGVAGSGNSSALVVRAELGDFEGGIVGEREEEGKWEFRLVARSGEVGVGVEAGSRDEVVWCDFPRREDFRDHLRLHAENVWLVSTERVMDGEEVVERKVQTDSLIRGDVTAVDRLAWSTARSAGLKNETPSGAAVEKGNVDVFRKGPVVVATLYYGPM